MEERRLLSHPTVTNQWFDYQTAATYTTRPQTINFTFDQDVSASLSPDDLRLEAVTGNEPDPIVTDVSWSGASKTATFKLAGADQKLLLPDGNYRGTIARDDLTNSAGESLASDAVLDFFVLGADANHDRVVDVTDLGILATNWQGTGRTFAQGDFSYDYMVDITDLGILSTNWQKYLMPPPAGPGEVTVNEPVTGAGLQLDWIDAVSGEAGWRVQRSTDGQTFAIYQNLPADSTTWTDTAVVEGKRYWYRVRAFGNGQDTAYTPKAAATTVLLGPGNVVAMEKGSTSATIAWQDNSQNESNFDIYLSSDNGANWSLAASVAANTQFADMSGLSSASDYRFRVRARNATATSAWSSDVWLEPSAPTAITATEQSGGLLVGWTNHSSRATGYVVQRAAWPDSGDFVPLAQVGPSATSFLDASAQPGAGYAYRVRAITSNAASAWSVWEGAGASPDQAPATPSVSNMWFGYAPRTSGVAQKPTLNVTFDKDVSASLASGDLWLEQVGSAEPPVRAAGSLTYDAPTNTACFAVNPPGGTLGDGNWRAVISRYDVSDDSGNPLDADGVLDFFALGADANHDRVVDVTDLGILATNWQGTGRTFAQGDFSYDGSVDVTDLGILATNWQKTLPAAAAAPTLSVGAATQTQVNLSWTAVEGCGGYRVQWWADGQATPNTTDLSGATTPSAVIGPLADGTRYWFRVRAFGNGQDTAYTPKATTTITLSQPYLHAPDPVTDVTTNSVRLTWDDNSTTATGFIIYAADDFLNYRQLPDTVSANADHSPVTYTVHYLKDATRYSFEVVATNALGESMPSPSQEVATQPNPPLDLTMGTPSPYGPSLRWLSNTLGGPEYYIDRSQDNSNWQIDYATSSTADYVDWNAVAHSSYYYRVRAGDPVTGYRSAYSNVLQVISPYAPGAPVNLTAKPVAGNKIQLDWTETDPGVQWFQIEYSSDEGLNFNDYPGGFIGGSPHSFTTDALTPSTTVYFRICGFAAAGRTDYSNIAFAVVDASVPVAPSSLTSTPSYNWVKLAWQEPGNEGLVKGYQISVSDSDGSNSRVAGFVPRKRWVPTTFYVTGLDRGKTYNFQVVTVRPSGETSAPATTTATTLVALPAPPTQYPAGTADISDVQLSWTDNASNETGFSIKYWWLGESGIIGNGGFDQPGALPGTGQTVTRHLDLSQVWPHQGVAFEWSVVAYNNSGDSSITIPSAASDVHATQPEYGTYRITWTDNSTNEEGFEIFDNNVLIQTAWGSGNGGGTGAAACDIYGLDPTANHSFSVVAYNAAGDAPSTTASLIRIKQTAFDASKVHLEARGVSPSEIDLTWSGLGTGGFQNGRVYLERSDDGFYFYPLVSVSGAGGMYRDMNLRPGTYIYRLIVTNVSFINMIGTSNQVAATTVNAVPTMPVDPDDPTQPPPPPTQPPIDNNSQGGHGWYKVTLGTPAYGDAPDDDVTVTELPNPNYPGQDKKGLVASDQWIQADSAQDAVMQAITGSLQLDVTPPSGSDMVFTDNFADDGFRLSGFYSTDPNATQFSGTIDLDTDQVEGRIDWDDWWWSVNVVKAAVDLRIDSNNDGTIDRQDKATQDDPGTPGQLVVVNDDDDNENGIPDNQESGAVAGEDNLIPVQLSVFPSDLNGTLELSVPSGGSMTKFYESPDRSSPLTQTSWQVGQQPSTVYLEANGASLADGDVQIKASVTPATTQSAPLATSQARLTFADVQGITGTLDGVSKEENTQTQAFVGRLKFETGAIAVLKSSPGLQLEARIAGAAAPFVQNNLDWAVVRNQNDNANLGQSVPSLAKDQNNPLKAVLSSNSVGSFKVIFFDNLNGQRGVFDPNKDIPLKDFRVAIIGLEVKRSSVTTRANFAASPTTMPDDKGGILFTSGNVSPTVNNPAIDEEADIELTGGGADMKLGADQVKLGWIGNGVSSTIVGHFDHGHSISEKPLQGLVLDTQRNNAGSGADSAFRVDSQDSAGAPQPQRVVRNVSTTDVPEAVMWTKYKNTGDSLTDLAGALQFRDYLTAYTYYYSKTYVAAGTVNWGVDFGASQVTLPQNNRVTVLAAQTNLPSLNGVTVGPTWHDLSKDFNSFYVWTD